MIFSRVACVCYWLIISLRLVLVGVEVFALSDVYALRAVGRDNLPCFLSRSDLVVEVEERLALFV